MGCVGQVGALGPGGEAGGSGLFMLLSRGERACGARAGSAAAGGGVPGPGREQGGLRTLSSCPARTPPCGPGSVSPPLWARFLIHEAGVAPINLSGCWEGPCTFPVWIDCSAVRTSHLEDSWGPLTTLSDLSSGLVASSQWQPGPPLCPTWSPGHPNLGQWPLLPSPCPSTPPGAPHLQDRRDRRAEGLGDRLLMAAAPGLSDLSLAESRKRLCNSQTAGGAGTGALGHHLPRARPGAQRWGQYSRPEWQPGWMPGGGTWRQMVQDREPGGGRWGRR